MNNRILFVLFGLVAMLAGCATLKPEDDQQRVTALIGDRMPVTPVWGEAADEVAARIRELLAEPLGPGEAVRVAMLANPEIHAVMAQAGLSRADVIRASRLPNPRLSLGFRVSNQPNSRREIETGVAFDLIALLLYRARRDIAEQEYDRDMRRAAHHLVDLANRVETAWFSYVGARQVAEMREIIAEAADVSAELAERFYRAGNISELQLLRERAAATAAQMNARRAELDAQRARLSLNRLMGLPHSHNGGRNPWRAAERLPAPTEISETAEALLAAARDHRLDLIALENEAATLEHALGVVRRWRFVTDIDERHLTPAGDVDVGVGRERSSSGERTIGPNLALRLPIFDQGQGALARAESRLAYAQASLEAGRLDVEQEVLQALADAETSRAIALEYRDTLIPQREAIVARSHEFFDFMFIGAFELIAARQQEYDGYQGYIEAVRDFWLARVELARAAGTTLALPFEEDELLDFKRLLEDPEAEDEDEHHHHHHHH